MRLACLHAPELALQAVLRRDPERRDDPIALADGPGERARVVAATERARRAGVRPGLVVNQARTVASALLGGRPLTVLPAVAADTAAAAAALGDVGYAFAPQIEQQDERVFLDVG